MKNRKSYTRQESNWNITLKAISAAKTEFTFHGKNTNDVESVITIIVDNYSFPYMVKDMMRIIQDEINKQVRLKDSVKSATII